MEYRKLLNQKQGQLKQIEQNIVHFSNGIKILQEQKEDLEAAQAIIQLVAQATQEELKYHISEIVTLALASVFDDPYELDVDFVQRRNQIEADIWFVREGERVHPLSASGGGAVNVAAFALRVALWSLSSPRTRPILILDEPFQNVKGVEANIKCIQMVKAISERLGLQVIMVSDERVPLTDIEAGADKIFHVSMKKGYSHITSDIQAIL